MDARRDQYSKLNAVAKGVCLNGERLLLAKVQTCLKQKDSHLNERPSHFRPCIAHCPQRSRNYVDNLHEEFSRPALPSLSQLHLWISAYDSTIIASLSHRYRLFSLNEMLIGLALALPDQLSDWMHKLCGQLHGHLWVKERLLGDDDCQQLQEGGGSCPPIITAPVVHTRQLTSHRSQDALQHNPLKVSF